MEKHSNDVHNGQKKLERASAENKSLSQNQVENITMEFSCKYCDKTYTQLALDKHIRFCDKKNSSDKIVSKNNNTQVDNQDKSVNDKIVQDEPLQDKPGPDEPAHDELSFNKNRACDICKRGFESARSLKIHSWTNHKKKKCNICDKVFSQPNWKGHMNTHENIIQCDLCSSKFSCKNALNKHVQAIHENIRFKCDSCPH